MNPNGSEKLRHATGLYLEGIRDGNIKEALDAHTGDRYTQHSTGVGDGREGFTAFFTPFIERNPIRDIQIIRAIEDGPYVFLHVYQSLNHGESQWVTADLFDTDSNDRVIEHWDVIQSFSTSPKSGHSMTDGETSLTDLDRTEANKHIVQKFCNTVLIDRKFSKISEFVSQEGFKQHSPELYDGIEGLSAYLANNRTRKESVRYWKIHKLVGQGNFVATLSQVQRGASHYCVFDIYRLENHLITEHWDVSEKILPPEEWNNQGKF